MVKIPDTLSYTAVTIPISSPVVGESLTPTIVPLVSRSNTAFAPTKGA